MQPNWMQVLDAEKVEDAVSFSANKVIPVSENNY